jgi:hypothetical protein
VPALAGQLAHSEMDQPLGQRGCLAEFASAGTHGIAERDEGARVGVALQALTDDPSDGTGVGCCAASELAQRNHEQMAAVAPITVAVGAYLRH